MMNIRATSVLVALLVLLIAACDPIHFIGSVDQGLSNDGGLVACTSGCACGEFCGRESDDPFAACQQAGPHCDSDGGCPGSDVCLTPIDSEGSCSQSHCFQTVGSAPCSSAADCPCGYDCTQSAGGGVCSPLRTCTSGADCFGGDCVEVYSNGATCGMRVCDL